VTGNLCVGERARPVTFDGTAALNGDTEVSLDAEVHIDRADFGLTWNKLGVASMTNTLIIHAVFTKR
jgi:polyisoprenoid-binding protein YceI